MAGRGRQAMMSITVPTAGELVFTPTQLDALGVTIFDQEGWLATAGFQSGDKIVSLDGESFDNVRSLQFALMRALSARGGEIEVQRGGALVSIPIRAGEVTDFSDLGGMLEPTSRGGGQ